MRMDLTQHLADVGGTQSGKTTLANFQFNLTGGLFVDIEDKGQIDAEITFTRKRSVEKFIYALKHYHTVKYVPSTNKKLSSKELLWIWEVLKKLNKNTYIYVDEIQNWGDARKNVCDVFAIRGLKHGVHLVSIFQRPAFVSKTIATQTKTWIFFDMSEMEEQYFKLHNLPYDDIRSNIVKQPKHSFVMYVRGVGVSRATKLKGIK